MPKKQNNQNLNPGEKKEIKEDVKDAIGKALEKPHTSIDKTLLQGTKETLNQDEVDKIVNKNKKTTTDKKLALITIFLIIVIALAGIFMYFANNPKTIFIKAIDKTFNALEKMAVKEEKTQGTIKINYNQQTNDKKQVALNNLDIKLDYKSDTKQGLLDSNINIKYKKEPLLNAKIYKQDNKTYLYSEDILNKYIEMNNNPISNKDISIIIKSLKKATIKSLEIEKITGSKRKVQIGEETIKTYKSSLVLNKDNIDTILNTINDTLKEDKQFINTLTKINKKTKEETKNELTQQINKIKENLKQSDNITINIYTKGAGWQFVKLEIAEVQNNEINVISFTKIDQNNITYNINNRIDKQEINGNINYKIDKNNFTLKIISGIKLQNQEPVNLTINIDSKTKKLNKIEKIDIKEKTNINTLTEEEQTYIGLKMISNQTLMKLLNEVIATK